MRRYMKHSISLAVALLHIVCNADSVTIVPSQQSWNAVGSDTNLKFDRQSNNSTHTVYVPTTVTFSTQHKYSHHHTSTPQYNLHHMNTEQLAWYFSTHGYTEGEVLSHPMLYMNAAYLALAKQLPRYPEYVKMYHDEYKKFNWFTKGLGRILFIYKPKLQRQFALLWRECEKVRECKEREERTQKQKGLAAYCAKLEALNYNELMIDAIPYQHKQARNKAQAHIKTAALDRATRQYTLTTHDIIIFASEYNIAECDLISLQGNAYEQQLHSEFLEQLDEALSISTAYALQPENILVDAIGHGIAIGMEANRLQQPDTATVWANFGWKAIEIIKGIGDGLLLCTESMVHCIHDSDCAIIEFVHALGNITGYCARAIGTVAHWHELMEQGNGLLMAQEIDDVTNRIAVCSTLCADKLSTMSTRDITKNITHIALDMVITHKMLTLGSTLCTQVKPIVCNLIKNIHKEEVFVEFALQGAEEFSGAQKISFLTESSTETLWISKGGLIYGPDKKFGTRVNHVLQHTKVNTSKLNHTVFTMTGNELFDLIDFAWSKRGIALADDPGTYIIGLEKIIGTQGEKAIKIVVIPGTTQLITAYPIKV